MGSTGNGISSCVAAAMEIGAMQIRPLKIRSMKIKAVRVDYISVLVKSLVARQPLCGVGLQHSSAGGWGLLDLAQRDTLTRNQLFLVSLSFFNLFIFSLCVLLPFLLVCLCDCFRSWT